VVDGLDEAEPEATSDDRGLPLGLPASLPDGVFVVATSRFGIDRALHAVRNPADWLQIEVEGADNLDDMRRFIKDVTSPDSGDPRLVKALSRDGVDVGWFRSAVAEACAGVWIYLRYVLDEIRDGRDVQSVARLPEDLAGYYGEQIQRWRGKPGEEAARAALGAGQAAAAGALAAARAPLTVAELASFAGVPSPEAARVFIEETAGAFLSRRDDGQPGLPRYALRHQSMRDLLTGNVPAGRPDLASVVPMLAAQAWLAHQQIIAGLIPPGASGERDWESCGPYVRRHLAAHAAVCGEIDSLACDLGFLLAADPGTVLAQRGNLRTPEGKRALAAFDLALDGWQSCTTVRMARLAVSAARLRATELATACAQHSGGEWPIRWAAWTGQVQRKLAGHGGRVRAVAIGRAGDRDVIVSGSDDRTVRVWDAVTGDPVGSPLAAHDGSVTSVAIGRTGDREVIASGSADRTVLMHEHRPCRQAS